MARRYIISDDEIKRIHVNILVNTGAYNLCIIKTVQPHRLFFRKGKRAIG